MNTIETRQKLPSSAQWSLSMWLGVNFGATVWLYLLGQALIVQFSSTVAGVACVIAAAISNALAIILWCAKDRLSPHVAIQCILLTSGLCALAAVLVIKWQGQIGKLDQAYGGMSMIYFALLIYPGAMMISWRMERRRNAAGLS